MTHPLTRPVAIIGAGSSGLVAARVFLQHGFDVQIFEREDDIGGNWNFGKPNARVYQSTHTISSKPFTQFPDFPMPDEFPSYPHHSQILEYLRRYAEHYDLHRHIRLEHEVLETTPLSGGRGWRVTYREVGSDDIQSDIYRALIVANGHNWSPKIPDVPGDFDGQIIHSAQYREPSIFEDKTVLVVGAGNTGCDVVVQAARHAKRALHSTRRGYWYAPKFVFGKPGDQIYDLMLSLPIPPRILQTLLETSVRFSAGHPTKAGLKEPDHRFLETHPVTNDLLVYYALHGRIEARDDLLRFEGPQVVFKDGQRDDVDLVCYCTGYLISLPFLPDAFFQIDDGRPQLYLNIFSPRADDLFFVGLIQPDSGQFKLVHYQAVAAARYLRAQTLRPDVAKRFRCRIADKLGEAADGGIDYAGSTRHTLEVQHMDYIEKLDNTIADLRSH